MVTEMTSTGIAGQTIDVGSMKIYYEAQGSGDTLIFLHGSMGTGKVWEPYSHRDQFLLIENAVELYRWIPNAQLAVIPNADLFVTRTHVDQVASLVEKFAQSF